VGEGVCLASSLPRIIGKFTTKDWVIKGLICKEEMGVTSSCNGATGLSQALYQEPWSFGQSHDLVVIVEFDVKKNVDQFNF
jgi:hypothetical protein